MPSYQKHVLFSIIIALPFIQDVFYLSLAVIGASMIDMDHHVKKKNLILMVISGILLCIILYFLKLSLIISLPLIIMSIMFYVSKHRGFVHSLPGILILSFLLTFFILGIHTLFYEFNINSKIIFIIISLILGVIILNKKILFPFFIITLAGIILSSNILLNSSYIYLSILLGSLSHIMLDLFTPSGIKLFNPISRRNFKQKSGVVLIVLWGFLAFIFILNNKHSLFLIYS
jgi:inner membrane protein